MENSDRIYKVYVREGDRFLGWLLMVVVLGFGLFFIALKLSGSIQENDSTWIFAILMMTWTVGPIYRSLSFPHTISLSPDGRIEFTSTLKQKVVYAREVRSIKPEGLQSFLVVRANRKSIAIWPQFDGFHDFVARLKAMNPNIELRGC